MSEIKKKPFLVSWLLFPLASIVYLFKNFKSNTDIRPYLLLSFYFGLSFIVSAGGADSMRYAEVLEHYHQQNYSLSHVIGEFYTDGGKLDVYQPILTWLVSVYTDNSQVLFALFSVVFGFFWFKSLILIRSSIQIPLSGFALVLFVHIALVNPIWDINGVRMWTAMGACIYGLLLLTLEKDKIGWLYLVSAIFIHFSFVLVLVLYVAYRFLPFKERTTLFFVLYVVTALIEEIDLGIIRNTFAQLPSFAQSKSSYVGEAYVEKVAEADQRWGLHVIIAQKLGKYSIILMTILMYYYSVYKKKIKSEFLVLFTLALFFASFSNIASLIPSGGRFVRLSNFLISSSFLFFINYKVKIDPIVKTVLTLALIGSLIFKIRMGLDFLGILFFIGNPIVNWFIEDVPIIHVIKEFL